MAVGNGVNPPATSKKTKSRKRPIVSWFKKLAPFRSSANKHSHQQPSAAHPNAQQPNSDASHEPRLHRSNQDPRTVNGYKYSGQEDGAASTAPDGRGSQSAAPTLNTTGDTANSDAGMSKSATTSATLGQGAGSIFSSSNHSQRSLTTTLTTIQSTAPSAHLNNAQQTAGAPSQQAATSASGHPTQATHSSTPSQGSTYFSHQYPTAPASAVPAHVAQSFLPTTYRSATANNLLSDNASVLTLASSSHNRRRRGSIDTDASVRAIPPSSQWGGSRESLPLSTLSTTTDLGQNASTTGGLYQQAAARPTLGGIASTERQSVYSSSGAAQLQSGALSSERSSLQAVSRTPTAADAASLRGTGDAKSLREDAASIRSGLHGRNGSIAGSINNALSASAARNDAKE